MISADDAIRIGKKLNTGASNTPSYSPPKIQSQPKPSPVISTFNKVANSNVGGFAKELPKAVMSNPVMKTSPARMAGAGLSKLGNALSTPMNAFGGFLQGTRKEAENRKGQGIGGIIPSLTAGIKNIPTGVKQKISPGRYLTEDVMKEKDPLKAAGIGLATDLVADPLNLVNPFSVASKLSKAAKLPSLATKVTSKAPIIQKGVDKVGDAFVYGYKQPEKFMKMLDNVNTRGMQKAAKTAEDVASPLLTKNGVKMSAEEQKIIGDVLENLDVQREAKVAGGKIKEVKKAIDVEKALAEKNLIQAKYGYKPDVKIAGLLPEGKRNYTPITKEYLDKVQGFSLPTRIQTSGAVKYQRGLEKIKKLESKVNEVGLKTKGLTSAEQQLINKYTPLANRTAKKFEKLAKTQTKLGIPEDVFSKYLGTYTGKRSYLSKIEGAKDVSPFAQPKQLRLNLSQYKERADIPKEVREAMGQIKEPAYGAATAAFNEQSNIEKLKFYKSVAKRYAGRAGEGMKKMPVNPNLGVLSGAYLPEGIYNYVNQVASPEKTAPFIKFFKEGKTILSPKQLIRNVPASQVQAMLNPSGRADSFRRIPEAIKEIRNKGKFYQEAKQAGVVGKTFAATELAQYLPEGIAQKSAKFLGSSKLGKVYEGIKKPGAAIQNANEEMAKMQVFINERKAGRSVAEAAKMAEETGFDYGKVTPWIDSLRKGKLRINGKKYTFGIPFATYGVKAAELTGKTLVKKPTRIANVLKTERAVERLSQDSKPDERYLPDYQKDAMRLPKKDKKGNPYYLNTKYLYPWGSMQDVGTFGLPLGQSPGPLFGESVSQLLNKDVFTKKEISTKPGMKGVEQRVKHAARTFLPTPIGSGMKIWDSATKKPRYSTSPSVGEAIVQEMGVPLFKYDSKLGKSFAGYDYQNKVRKLNTEMRKELQEQAGNPNEQRKIREFYMKELRKAANERR